MNNMETPRPREGKKFTPDEQVDLQLANKDLVPEWLIMATREARDVAESSPVTRQPELPWVIRQTLEVGKNSTGVTRMRSAEVAGTDILPNDDVLPFAA